MKCCITDHVVKGKEKKKILRFLPDVQIMRLGSCVTPAMKPQITELSKVSRFFWKAGSSRLSARGQQLVWALCPTAYMGIWGERSHACSVFADAGVFRFLISNFLYAMKGARLWISYLGFI